MERTKKTKGALEPIRYEFTGAGVHVTGSGRMMKKGDVMRALPSDISPTMKDRFKALDPEPTLQDEEDADLTPAPATLVPVHKGGGRYIVIVKETGTLVTDGYLNKQEAQLLCGDQDGVEREEA